MHPDRLVILSRDAKPAVSSGLQGAEVSDIQGDGKRAVVLLSGGIDSGTTLLLAREEGFDLYALTVDYGQRQAIEREAAARVANRVGVREHRVLELDLRPLLASALTGSGEIPRGVPSERIGERVPSTYVPARNTILLSLALGWAETVGAGHIFIGVNAVDYSGYPDCRPDFIHQFERLAALATRAGREGRTVHIRAPLMELSKAEIIRKGHSLGFDYGLTHSCYDPSPEGYACGECESCTIRKRGFREAGIPDPTRYRVD